MHPGAVDPIDPIRPDYASPRDPTRLAREPDGGVAISDGSAWGRDMTVTNTNTSEYGYCLARALGVS
jgi:hypothetical protein